MAEQQQQIKVQFRLTDIEEKQFVTLVNEWPQGEMQVSNQIQFNVDTESRIVRCSVSFEYKLNDITQMILSVENTFEFSPDSWSSMYQLQGDHWLLPAGLLQHLADITLGSARGIMAARTKDMGFPTIIIPLISTQQVIKNNLSVPRKQG